MFFFSQYLETDLDDNNFKDIEKATVNLLFLKCLEGDVQQRRLREEH